MAKKYIDCEAAIEKLCDRCGECLKAKGKDCAVVRIMDKIPAADVAPVIHAHWDFTPAAPWYPKCSHCEYQIIMPYTDDDYPNYCPNCGAKMDESEDGE